MNDTTAIDLFYYLPEVYRNKDRFNHLKDFLQPVSTVSQNFREKIAEWAKEFDIGQCRDDFLDEIGNLYGYRPRTAIPNLIGKRRKIRYAMDLWERKGTARGYYLSGIEVDIPVYDIVDNRYSVLTMSHQGKLSYPDEGYLLDNIYHHEGVIMVTAQSYLHPQIFFAVLEEFVPGGFMLYLTQTIHQGYAVYDPSPIGDIWFTKNWWHSPQYQNEITAEQIWYDLGIWVDDVFPHNVYWMDDSVGYKNSRLPFDPQKIILPGMEVPPGYKGPFGDVPGRPLTLGETKYPKTDPRVQQWVIDYDLELTAKKVCRVSCFFGVRSDIYQHGRGPQPYMIRVDQDLRVQGHTHWAMPGLEGDMTGNVIEYNGASWDYDNLSGRSYDIDSTSNIDATTLVIIETTSGATAYNPYIVKVLNDYRINKNIPVELSGDMSGKIIEYTGSNWQWSCVDGTCVCHCGTGGTGEIGGTGATGGTGGTGLTGGTGWAGISPWVKQGDDIHHATGDVGIGATPPVKEVIEINDGEIFIDNLPPTNNSACGRIMSLQIGEDVEFGDTLYMKDDFKLWKQYAIAGSQRLTVAMAVENGSADDYIPVLMNGFIRNDSWDFTKGEKIYIDSTAGLITQIAPIGTINEVIGMSTHTNAFLFAPSYGAAEAGRYESSLFTGSTGYTGSHALGVTPVIRIYNENWEMIQPAIVEVNSSNYSVEFEEETSCYIICI
ncbi:MAG: hypothetical protein V3W20_14765 [Candidatus Neomarinimicrobiota bacterium]